MSEITHSFRCSHPNLLVAKGFYLEPHGIVNPRSLEVWENFKEWKVIIKLPRMKDDSLGGKIRRYRSNNQAFSEEEVLKLFYEISSGLKYLHENKIAHRDLKPDNVLFNNEDIAVLSDFGLSTFTEDETEYYLRDDAGTKTHKAPEPQLKLKHRGLYPTDIWSFGVLIFEVCSPLGDNNEGTGEERQEKFKRVIEKLNYSSFLKELLLQMLRSDPAERIKINDLWEKLEEKLTGIPQRTTGMTVEDEISASKSEEKTSPENEQMQVEESKGEALNGRLKPGEFRDYEEDDRETSVLSVRDELRKDHGDLFDFEANATDQSLRITSKESTRDDITSDKMLGDLLEKLTTEVVGKDCKKFKEFSLDLAPYRCREIKGHSLAKLFGANQIDLEKLAIDLSGTSVNSDGLKELAIQISDNLKSLQDLRLTFPPRTKGPGVKILTEKVFSSLTGLKRVELALKIIENEFLDLLVLIASSCKKLEHLDLDVSGSILTSTGIQKVLAVEADSLRYLKLNFNGCIKMKNQGAAEIANYVLPQLKNLEHLELGFSQCRINDDGVFTLIEKITHTLPNLKHLILSFASTGMITAEGILKIADPIKSHLKNLEHLHLDFDKCNGDKEEKNKVKEELGNLSSFIKDVVIKIS